MTFSQDLEKEFRAFLGERDVTEFIENEQVEPGVFADQAGRSLSERASMSSLAKA